METTADSALADVIGERDRILIAFDVEAAKRFIVRHGGTAPKNVDWPTVLHLARYECESIKAVREDQWWDSRIFLARAGKYGVVQMPPNSPYVRTALNLVFPKLMTDRLLSKKGA